MIQPERTSLPEVMVFTPARFHDERGFFSETYQDAGFKAAGLPADIVFVQDNFSLSRPAGTVRGLHYQAPPMAQSKLVRVIRGSILDVAVDVRRGSPRYGQHVSVELSADNARQLFVPKGFLHGFITLEPDTEVAYKVDAYYSKPHDGAVLWNDPSLGIDWGPLASQGVVSQKDAQATRFAAFETPFDYLPG